MAASRLDTVCAWPILLQVRTSRLLRASIAKPHHLLIALKICFVRSVTVEGRSLRSWTCGLAGRRGRLLHSTVLPGRLCERYPHSADDFRSEKENAGEEGLRGDYPRKHEEAERASCTAPAAGPQKMRGATATSNSTLCASSCLPGLICIQSRAALPRFCQSMAQVGLLQAPSTISQLLTTCSMESRTRCSSDANLAVYHINSGAKAHLR